MFSTLAAIAVAPNEAFESIRERPAWAWALGATILLAMAGTLLSAPATRHILEITLPAQFANNPSLAGLPPDQVAAKTQQMLAFAILFANLWWLCMIVWVPLVILIETAALFVVRSIFKSRATFSQLFALATHVQFIGMGMYLLVLGAVVALRPVDSFHTQADFIGALPSAAWLAPVGQPKTMAFLAQLGPFQIWATAVLALGLSAVAQLRPALAWATAFLILLAAAGLGAAFIHQ